MATVAANLRTYLVAQSSVTDQVGTRVYFGNIPNASTLPAVAINLVRDETIRSINNGASGLYNASLDVEVHADTYTAANTAGEAIKDALDDYAGAMGSMTCRKCYADNGGDTEYAPLDASDKFRFVRSVDVDLWYV